MQINITEDNVTSLREALQVQPLAESVADLLDRVAVAERNAIDPTLAAYRTRARTTRHNEGAVEIDEAAPVSWAGEGGAYVQAWIWISDDELSEGGANAVR